tara:strand:+ start:505 stop:945 length:441 start_codon:yes stop_codon:yes gene_type:complete
MKDITIQLTDVQHHYLTELADKEYRSFEQLLYVLLHNGIRMHYCESDADLRILPGDFTEEEKTKVASTETCWVITRCAFKDDFEDLLNLKQNAQNLQKSIAADKIRDLEAELKELKQLETVFRERLEKAREAARAEIQAQQNASNN